MFYAFAFVGAAILLCAGCATGEQATDYADSAATQIVAAETRDSTETGSTNSAGKDSEKQSLNELLDEHKSVTLVDEETGKTKLICKRLAPQTGTRLSVRKTCMTPEQWDQLKQQSEDQLEDIQRRLDGRDPTG